jgi:hypothetical protein
MSETGVVLSTTIVEHAFTAVVERKEDAKEISYLISWIEANLGSYTALHESGLIGALKRARSRNDLPRGWEPFAASGFQELLRVFATGGLRALTKDEHEDLVRVLKEWKQELAEWAVVRQDLM